MRIENFAEKLNLKMSSILLGGLVSRQLKLMILANIILGLLFIASNFVFDYFGNMPSHHALWSPMWLTFYNYVFAAQFGDIGAQIPNFSFYFFWASIAVNLYFIIKLGRGRETKQNTT